MAGKLEAVVQFEYEKTQDDELTLKVGDVIQNVKQADEGWCEGTLNGKHGLFPDNFVTIRPAQGTAPQPADNNPPLRESGGAIKGRRAKVAFSYTAENADELSLEPGQIVEVIAEEEEGWFRGRLNGKEGVFPSNFLEDSSKDPTPPASEPAKPEEPSASKQPPMGHKLFPSINPALARANLRSSSMTPEKKPAPPPPASTIPKPEKKAQVLEKAKVTFEYKAENEDELTIVPGEIVEIIDKNIGQDGWWKVKLRDQTGLIPDNFVVIQPANPAPTQPPPPSTKAKAPLPPRSGSVSRPAPPQPDRPPPHAEPKSTTPAKEGDEASDFGVPHTDPLDSSAVKNRPKKTSRPPSRSNLHMDEGGSSEPAPVEPKTSAPQSSTLSPWQAELQKRKQKTPVAPPGNKPPPPAPKKAAVKPPAAAAKPPPPSANKPHTVPKPQVESTSHAPRDTSSPHPPAISLPVATATSSTMAPPPVANDAWKEAYENLRDEFEKFKKHVEEQFAILTNDLDDERKHWRGLEVDIDRLKKKSSLSK